MIGFHGTRPSDALKRVLHETGARSVILFARNIENAAQCRELIDGIRAMVDWPLLVAVDQEGGAVVRVLEGATVFPGNMALGAANDVELARAQGRESGAQLAAMGFDLNLAPVVDLQTNPANPGIGIRSLGAQRDRAVALARALVQGHAEHGVASCLKHFPGKGAASVDAHIDLPVLEMPRSEFEEPHLRAFVELFDAEDSLSLMTTHMLVEGLDPELPATLSRAVVSELLRKELGFDGLVIADDMEMGAIVKHHGVPGAVLRAAQAGHDLIPICHTAEWQVEAAQHLDAALASGELDRELHLRSLERIDARVIPSRPEGPIDPAAGDAVATEIAQKSVHCFGDPGHRIPLARDGELLVLSVLPHAVVGVEEDAERDWPGLLRQFFAERREGPVRVECFEADPGDAEQERLCGMAADASLCLLLTWNARASAGQAALIQRLGRDFAEQLVVAHLRNPFDQLYVPKSVTALTPFGYHIAHLEALADSLCGVRPAHGLLPAPIE
jgi:beta-N-acetylhexosaminidase